MTTALTGASLLEKELRGEDPAIVPYLTAGFPTMDRFAEALVQVSAISEAVEIGIPFSDPMADGATIQESSRVALEGGATLERVIATLEALPSLPVPLVVMSYLNPLMAYGYQRLFPRLAAAGVAALVVPDLPLEESGELKEVAGASGIGLVQLVTPVTDDQRLRLLGAASEGFTYAVTMTGTTGGSAEVGSEVGGYLDRVRRVSMMPVLAGFGVRSADQVRSLVPHCDGVIVGSALVEVLGRGDDPVAFLEGLRS
ncbi:MAG: tryptophan synthase subunit alpha [Acidimicrobiia bacterium]